MAASQDIFAVHIGSNILLYAPLHHLVALVDSAAAEVIRAALKCTCVEPPPALWPIVEQLRAPVKPPAARTGPLRNPIFLGLIPTRNCNLGCRYCDFAAPKSAGSVMPLKLAAEAIEAYFSMLVENGETYAAVHFFGGEPFYAESVVHFAVGYAAHRAKELGLQARFEVTTNGLYNQTRCEWIADNFDTVVLSLDGPQDIQDRHRPALNGSSTFALIARNAQILSNGSAELILRACVTSDTVNRLPEIARWIGKEFRPAAVCFESLTVSPLSQAASLNPPDPWTFAQNFEAAANILADYGIETVLSTANLDDSRATFCPVGRDALIVTPEGAVNACYLLEEDWQRAGMELRLGSMSDGQFDLDPASLETMRALSVYTRPLCNTCLCRFHCAGGCVVNHQPQRTFDDLCIQTRLVTITKLLHEAGQPDLAQRWLEDPAAMETAAWQPTDRLDEGGL